jgi:two-component system response regulator FixJ
MSEHTEQVACSRNRATDPWIAVIDPDTASCDRLRTLLDGLDAVVRTYPAAEPFLQELRAPLPICLIAEVDLPAMSGLMLLRQLKVQYQSVPSILLVRNPSVWLAVEVIREGVLDFIEKPLTDDRIASRVSALLSLQSTHEETT